tara:strand:- start:93 stop:785 length:693 start_codon:yes stop_codon:yes gene_type:complete
MISPKATNFKYIDRGYTDPIVLIPGWATDYRIFDSLDLKFNYLVPIDFYPFGFEKSLLEVLKEKRIKKVSLLGLSLGGFIAAAFASKYVDLVDEVILIGIRKKYDKAQLRAIKPLIQKNKKAYLYKFYSQCFTDAEEMNWFRTNLLEGYCEEFDIQYLLDTLDSLEDFQITNSMLKGIGKLKIVHGEKDKIAPIEEAIEIKNQVNKAKFIPIKDAGHMPFWGRNFSDNKG